MFKFNYCPVRETQNNNRLSSSTLIETNEPSSWIPGTLFDERIDDDVSCTRTRSEAWTWRRALSWYSVSKGKNKKKKKKKKKRNQTQRISRSVEDGISRVVLSRAFQHFMDAVNEEWERGWEKELVWRTRSWLPCNNVHSSLPLPLTLSSSSSSSPSPSPPPPSFCSLISLASVLPRSWAIRPPWTGFDPWLPASMKNSTCDNAMGLALKPRLLQTEPIPSDWNTGPSTFGGYCDY